MRISWVYVEEVLGYPGRLVGWLLECCTEYMPEA